jgi:hypothetical protein
VQGVEQQRTESSGLSPWEQLAQLLLLTNEFCYVD